MKRRLFLATWSGAVLAIFSTADAQQRPRPILGLLGLSSPNPSLTAFLEGLQQGGYVDGQNVTIEYRWAEGKADLLPALAAELVDRKVDVIVASGGILAARVAKNATSTIPIVFEVGVDPVEAGLVSSFARPGGNLTGVSILTGELNPKRLELLSELLPQARTVGLLVNPKSAGIQQSVKEAADAKKLKLIIENVGAEDAFEPAFTSFVEHKVDGLLVGNDPVFFSRRHQIVALAARYRVPSIYEWREFASAGGLISYGSNINEMFRQAGLYTARILAGNKPTDLPVIRPTKFELVINMQTAKALGITLPQALLTRADEVIE